MEININYKNPSLTQHLFDNTLNNVRNFFTPIKHVQPTYQQPKKPKFHGNFTIRYDSQLHKYMIYLYLGNKNKQKVAVILDTNQVDILIPTNCCINRGCLTNPEYGLYYFKMSESCKIPLPNDSMVDCEKEDCYTITTLQPYIDQKGIYEFGSIKKVKVYEYLSFGKQSIVLPMNLIMGYYTNEGYLSGIDTYIPPTLGLGPGNTLNQNYIYLDLKNNYLSFDKQPNEKCILKQGTTSDHYSGIVEHVTINNIKLNTTPLSVIFDTGTDLIRLPQQVYEAVLT